MLEAAKAGNLHVVKKYLGKPEKIDKTDSKKWTALHYACYGGHAELASYLLSMKAKANMKTNKGETPLHFAAKIGNETILISLVEYNADLDAIDSTGRTPLHYAVEAESFTCVKFLLDFGANPNIYDFAFFTPLHEAIKITNEYIMQCLFEHKANPNIIVAKDRVSSNTVYCSPLMLAVQLQQIHLCEELINNHANVNEQNKQDATALHFAAQYDDAGIIKLLLDSGANLAAKDVDGETPLMLAVRNNKVRNIELLAQNTVSIGNATGLTALHMACHLGYPNATSALLQAGAPVMAEDSNGDTPLHCAVRCGSTECVQLLLDAGADPMKRNGPPERPDSGASPFVLAGGEVSAVIRKWLDQRIKEGATVACTPKKSPTKTRTPQTKKSRTRTPQTGSKTYTRLSPMRGKPSETPRKDAMAREKAEDLDALKEQIDAAIEETRDIMTRRIEEVRELLSEIREDFAAKSD